jgi:hypothetical protein
MLQEIYEADNMGLVLKKPVLDVAIEEGHYAVYTSNARYSDKPDGYVLTAYKAMMKGFYTRKICQKIR